MYFGLKGMTREADDYLAAYQLGRAHHRVLFVVARRPGVTVGELARVLGVSAQALHRPLRQLRDGGFVAVRRDPERRRYKRLELTDGGRAVEHGASACERAVMRAAFTAAPGARDAWSTVMAAVAAHA